MTTTTDSSRFSTLLRQASQWRLMALLLSRPAQTWGEQVKALRAEVGDDELIAAADAACAAASAPMYDTTFGPGGPAAPREVSYRACLDAHFLSELSALYKAFSYQPDSEQPLDHVAVQTDFIAYLRLKELYALSRGDDEQAQITSNAAQRVLQEHLSRIARPLADSLGQSGIPYLAIVSAALAMRVGNPPRAPDPLPVLHTQEQNEYPSCCSFDELAAQE